MRTWHRVTLIALAVSAAAFLIGTALPWVTVHQAPGTFLMAGRAINYRGGTATLTGTQLIADGLLTRLAVVGAIAAVCVWRSARFWWVGAGLWLLAVEAGAQIPTPHLAGVETIGTGVGLTIARAGWTACVALMIVCVMQAMNRRIDGSTDDTSAPPERKAPRIDRGRLSPEWFSPTTPSVRAHQPTEGTK